MKCLYCIKCKRWRRTSARQLSWRNVMSFCDCERPKLTFLDDFLSDYAIAHLLARRTE